MLYVCLYNFLLGQSYILYEFNDSRNTDKFKELLKDYKGYVVCDGYAEYDSLKRNGIVLHIRKR